jgi:hypothetical protein
VSPIVLLTTIWAMGANTMATVQAKKENTILRLIFISLPPEMMLILTA